MFHSREPGVSGNFRGRIKGAKYRFPLQDGTWDFPGDAVAGKGLILDGGGVADTMRWGSRAKERHKSYKHICCPLYPLRLKLNEFLNLGNKDKEGVF